MSIKISYTDYKDHPEATEYSKATGILSFILIVIGFIAAFIIMDGGGWKIPLGILIMAGTLVLARLFTVSSKRHLADIADPVIDAIAKSGIDVTKQYKLKYNKNPFSLDDNVYLRIVIDQKNNLFCFASSDNPIQIVPFNELYYFAATQGNEIIGELGVRLKSSVISTIEYRKADQTSAKNIPVDLGIGIAKASKPIPFCLDCPPNVTIEFYNTMVDEIKDALEKYSGVKPIIKPRQNPTSNSGITKNESPKEQFIADSSEKPNPSSIPSQIKQLKQLADDNIITREEFEEKKKELLKRM